MGLVTIADLHREQADVIAKYMSWAGDLSLIYERFVREDEDDVSFVAGWHGAKARTSGIHASEMSGACRRPVWYSLRGAQREDRELDPFWKKRFRIGHMYHAMIQEDWRRICEQSGGLMTFEREVRIGPDLQAIAREYDIQSSCDGVITFRDEPWGAAVLRVGLEIKTESPDQFKELKEPKEQHRRQTCVYMRCLDVPLLWTMYVNKGNQNIVESKPPYLFKFDFQLWGAIEQETKEVIRLATINEIPPRHEGLNCEFCGYAHACQPEYMKKKERREAGKKERAAQAKRLKKMGHGGIRVPSNFNQKV